MTWPKRRYTSYLLSYIEWIVERSRLSSRLDSFIIVYVTYISFTCKSSMNVYQQETDATTGRKNSRTRRAASCLKFTWHVVYLQDNHDAHAQTKHMVQHGVITAGEEQGLRVGGDVRDMVTKLANEPGGGVLEQLARRADM